VTIEIFDCEQGSDEWLRLRMGTPTASEFATVMAQGKGGGESKTRRTYMLKLAGEILTGDPMDNYTNVHMERGKEMEAEARSHYAFVTDVDLTPVGFVRNGRMGCSPDRLVGANGALEIKTKLAHLQIECLLKNEFPPDHKAQCQGILFVSEREWIDLGVYWPKLPMLVTRAKRDEPYLKMLKGEIDRFNDELDQIVARIRAYGPKAAAA
jgi:hypothetical protein